MKANFLCFLLGLSILTGCNKSTEAPCNLTNLVIVNNSNDTYKVSINNRVVSFLDGGRSNTQELEFGFYSVKAEQEDGYLLFPSVFEKEFNVNACGDVGFSFP